MPSDRTGLFGDVGEDGRGVAEQGGGEEVPIDPHRVRRPLVTGQVVDQLDEDVDVPVGCLPDHRRAGYRTIGWRGFGAIVQGTSRTRPNA